MMMGRPITWIRNFSIDEYIQLRRRDEDIETRKSRLMLQSRKRGVDIDVTLSSFADKYLKDMNEEEVQQYDRMINQPSNHWEIYNWVNGIKPVPPEHDNAIFRLFKEFAINLKKQLCVKKV